MKPKAARVFWAARGVQESLTSHSSDTRATGRTEHPRQPCCSRLSPWDGPVPPGQGKGQHNWGWCCWQKSHLLREIPWSILSPFYNHFPPRADTNHSLPAATTDPYPSRSGSRGSPPCTLLSLAQMTPAATSPQPCVLCPLSTLPE